MWKPSCWMHLRSGPFALVEEDLGFATCLIWNVLVFTLKLIGYTSSISSAPSSSVDFLRFPEKHHTRFLAFPSGLSGTCLQFPSKSRPSNTRHMPSISPPYSTPLRL
ncbi:hypothetical protein MIND_01287100 [Mycena indigotica]|uniref:Uncharacterized protein n=1 Tax=Mycena indigotica TaxID=2126181 RepID=A0A8H6S1Y1_9AGAR|nr:uncharacterized protein MIND_01287100 [Mycena indigotica]KAF7291424.1 hypothetical protein MIND_01287100 [Mycena indigotica]